MEFNVSTHEYRILFHLRITWSWSKHVLVAFVSEENLLPSYCFHWFHCLVWSEIDKETALVIYNISKKKGKIQFWWGLFTVNVHEIVWTSKVTFINVTNYFLQLHELRPVSRQSHMSILTGQYSFCNYVSAESICSACVKRKKPCESCLLRRTDGYHHTLCSRQLTSSEAEPTFITSQSSSSVDSLDLDKLTANGLLVVTSTVNIDQSSPDYTYVQRTVCLRSGDEHYLESNADIHTYDLVSTVYDGAISCKHVDLIIKCSTTFAAGNYSANCLIVYCSLMLQRYPMVEKISDIKRVLEWWMLKWDNEKCDQFI